MGLPSPYYQDDWVTIYHDDCRELAPRLSADLLLTDPPYGLGVDSTMHKQGGQRYGRAATAKTRYRETDWDVAPDAWVLHMLCAITDRQIIWGGNYFGLPPSRGWLVWDKVNGDNQFADCELAWTSLDIAVRKREHMWNGMLRQGREDRWHPTQKPLSLIKWCIGLAAPVQSILDPFAGSGTTGRAAKDLGVRAVLIERDAAYCATAAERCAQEVLPMEAA